MFGRLFTFSRFTGSLIMLLFAIIEQSVAQSAGTVLVGAGSPGSTSTVNPPEDISASDGTYDQFVLIRWSASDRANAYRIFRTIKPDGTALQEISKGWQKSTWLCDYSALPEVDYYYAVVASDGHQTSPAGTLDKGFLKKKPAVAIEGQESLAQQNILFGTDERKFFLLISSVESTEQLYAPGATVSFNVHLQNIFEASSPRTELRYFLSKDTRLDWSDTQVHQKVLSAMPPNVKFTVQESIVLPKDISSGDYFLIVVSSPEGDVLQSKTGHLTLKIQTK